MTHHWPFETLNDEAKVRSVLVELQGKNWLCRGQGRPFNSLVPAIDRGPLGGLSRKEKLERERQSIDIFQETARFFVHPGERGATSDENLALMVLRHYVIPTRLLDWTSSPYIAAYFASEQDDDCDGEIWAFDGARYAENGKQQWKKWPETTSDGRATTISSERN